MVGQVFSGRFVLEQELGRGGMGAVYRAHDLVLGRRVAIKFLKDLDGEEVARKIRLEAQILARLLHESIVRLYDLGIDGTTYFFVMEEVEGSSFFKRWRKLTIEERFRILAQTADALDYAHHQGILHRDIKPANILTTAADQPKLSDFGLSTYVGERHDPNIVRGTPQYMSPEQAQAKRIDHRSDLYSVGIMMYECATGSTPFSGHAMAILTQHVRAEPEPPRARHKAISPELETLILETLSKSPESRPATGAELAARIRALIASDHLGRSASSDRSTVAGAGGNVPGSPASSALAAEASGEREASIARGFDSVGEFAAPRVPDAQPTLVMPPSNTSLAPSVAPGVLPRHELVRTLVQAVAEEPILLSADERYLYGHYLAYLLGGARRSGILRRRPLDPLNADRARLLLAMSALCLPGERAVSMGQAATLLDERLECRPALSPIVVAKYLEARSNPSRLKQFRKVRSQLQQASQHAARHLTDDQGVLNPGLMPQTVADLMRLAPTKSEIDDELVSRWNAISEVWREHPPFRDAVLRYATAGAWHDPASAGLWPEVVYPLIERARRQRHMRSRIEAFWEAICERITFLPDPGARMERALRAEISEEIVEQLDVAAVAYLDEHVVEAEEGPEDDEDRLNLGEGLAPATVAELQSVEPDRGFCRFDSDEPVRFTLGELRALWRESIQSLKAGVEGGTRTATSVMPIGSYRLTVIPSVRARAAGQVAIQGMANKQIEMIVPPFAGSGKDSAPVVAIWTYPVGSLAITYLDHLHHQNFICWDAEAGRQFHFSDPVSFNQTLDQLGLEVPSGLDRVLSRR